MTVELLDYGPEDVVTIGVSWLTPMLELPTFTGGQVSNTRRAGDPLPFIHVNSIAGEESVEESDTDEVLSIHTLFRKGNGEASAILAFQDGWRAVHQRMLLLSQFLEDIALPGGRIATVDYCSVFSRPRTEEYGDDLILRKVGRYRIGLSYAKLL